MTSPGWFPDPSGLPQSRYWNGSAWTPHIQVSGPVVFVEQRPAEWNALSILSLVFGVLYLGGIGSIAAIVLAHISVKQIDASAGRERGRIFAAIGLVLGYVGLASMLLFLAFIVFVSIVAT